MCWGTCHIEPSHTKGPCRCATQPQPHTALQLRFAVAFAITFTTATLLRSASLRLLPRSLLPFIPPKPIPVPTCWAPTLLPPTFPRSTSSVTSSHTHHESTQTQIADTSLRAFARRNSPAQPVLASCASPRRDEGILGVRA